MPVTGISRIESKRSNINEIEINMLFTFRSHRISPFPLFRIVIICLIPQYHRNILDGSNLLKSNKAFMSIILTLVLQNSWKTPSQIHCKRDEVNWQQNKKIYWSQAFLWSLEWAVGFKGLFWWEVIRRWENVRRVQKWSSSLPLIDRWNGHFLTHLSSIFENLLNERKKLVYFLTAKMV